MAVDLSIPNSVIQAYATGAQVRNQQERNELERQRLQQQNEQFLKRLEFQRLVQREANRRADIANDLALTRAKLAVGEALATGKLAGEQSFPGESQTISAMQDIGIDPIQAMQQYFQGQTLTSDILGRGNEVIAPSPESILSRQLGYEKARAESLLPGQIQLEIAKRNAQFSGNAALEAIRAGNRAKLAEADRIWRAEQNRLDREARSKDNDARVAARDRATAARTQIEQLTPEDIASFTRDVALGMVPITQYSREQKTAIEKYRATKNWGLLSPAESKQYGRAAIQIRSLVDQVSRFNEKHKDEFGKGLLGRGYQAAKVGALGELTDFGEERAILEVAVGNLARIFGGETGARLSDFDIKRMLGYLPNGKITYKDATDRLKQMKDYLFQITDDSLKARSLKDDQRLDFYQTLDNPYLLEYVQSPSVPTGLTPEEQAQSNAYFPGGK